MPTLTVRDTAAIRRIEEAIGYTFNDKRLLLQVLTRKTYLKIDPEAPDNEVLEFYGDTLMNYHVTNYFMSKFAHMLEDGLFFMRTVEQFTDMRSHYVCNRYLTERVKALGLARYLRAQNRDAELRRDGEKAYADIFESLVGAIYLDSYQNDNLIRAFILRQLGIEPKRLPDEIEAFDYDALQAPMVMEEAAQAVEAYEAPEAVEAPLPSAADPVAEATAEDVTEADEAVMVAEAPAERPSEPAAPTTNREKLATLCDSLGYEAPTYGETPKNAPNARPVAACTLKYKDAKGKLVKISLNDSGKTLAEATEKAAAKMLKKLAKQAADAAAQEAPAKPGREAAVLPSAPPAEETVAEAPVISEVETAAEIVSAVEAVIAAEAIAAVEAEEQPADLTPASEPASAVAEEAVPAEAKASESPAEEVTVEMTVEATAEATVEATAEVTAEETVKETAEVAAEAPAAEPVTESVEDKPAPKKPRGRSSSRSKKTDSKAQAKAAVNADETVAAPAPVESAPAPEATTPAEAHEEDKAATAKPVKARKPRASAKSKKAEKPAEDN